MYTVLRKEEDWEGLMTKKTLSNHILLWVVTLCQAHLGADREYPQKEEWTRQVERSRNGKWSEVMHGSPYSFPTPSSSPPAFFSIEMVLKHNRIRKRSFYCLLSDESLPRRRTETQAANWEELISMMFILYLLKVWDDCYESPKVSLKHTPKLRTCSCPRSTSRLCITTSNTWYINTS